jgi:hypothetical protein
MQALPSISVIRTNKVMADERIGGPLSLRACTSGPDGFVGKFDATFFVLLHLVSELRNPESSTNQ